MYYSRDEEIIRRKKELSVNNVTLAGVINKSPVTVAHKILGYLSMTALERKKIIEYLDQVERKQLTEAT